MTEAEWRRGSDVFGLLGCKALRPGARKLRLLLSGWLRAADVWPLLIPASRRAVEVSEAFADGAAGVKQLRAAYRRSYGAWAAGSRVEAVTAAMLANDACWQDS